MIGVCRERLGDEAGALVAYLEALEVDAGFGLAQEAKDRLVGGGG